MEQFLYSFSGLRWQDALDILVNSYILFRLYVLFRGTRVIRALLAIFVFWAAGQAAISLGLVITNWAMQGIITVAALIIIIVFRNEISSVLLTKNFKSFLWGIPKYQFKTPINIIVDSVFDLAHKKIGALIVLPLKQGMASVVQGGIPINGKLSQEMLVSIFWGENPLHDGATIIQGNQIISAGSILPLSKSEDLPSFFGTRHRAAQGLSEYTDAMIIVVSEERGIITMFKENQTHNIENRATLEQLLKDHTGDDSLKKGFRHPSINLIAAAIFCLLSITGLWFSFAKGMETFATHDVPVEFINPDQKMEIISTSASNVKLLISGAKPLINAIKPEQINIELNLSQSIIGMNKLAITKENILLPPGIRLKKIDPPELDIKLDTMIEKKLPIQPHWIGKLKPGLIMIEAKAVPSVVQVTGGGLDLKSISTLFTEPIQLDKILESGTIKVNLILMPASLKLKNKDKIQIEYLISKKTI